MTRRSVVTGIGVIAPGGGSRRAFWERITSGRSAIRRISSFDPGRFRSQVAAECDFDPAHYGLSARDVRRNDRFILMALAAAAEAVADAGFALDDLDQDRLGVLLGSAVGSTIRLEEEYVQASDAGSTWTVDGSHVMPFLYQALVPSSLAAEVAIRYGAHGPVSAISTGCTSGVDAIGIARDLIMDDEADVVITGASDAPISPITVACFDAIRATSPLNDDPPSASRPFDAERCGFVLGEGSAVLIVEELSHALKRGAEVYCEISGYACRANAFHMTGLAPNGTEMGEAIRDAVCQARLDPDDLDYVSAHGSGTRQNDRHETAALKLALGPAAWRVPVSSIKSSVGHSLGAIGSLEMAACALAIRHGVIPPTVNLRVRDTECDLDYVPGCAREKRVDHALSVASGFGGFQSAMVFSRLGERVG
jgi:minimal PKS ketosynthase (KS/KS alpha)